MARSALIGIVTLIPVLASILSFVSVQTRAVFVTGRRVTERLYLLMCCIDHVFIERTRSQYRYHLQFAAVLQRQSFLSPFSDFP